MRGLNFSAAACVAAAIAACGDDVAPATDAGGLADSGSGDASVSVDAAGSVRADAGPSCGGFGQDDDCARCLAEQCCVPGRSCGANMECAALVDCTRACSADAGDCSLACVSTHPTGRGPYNELVLCMGRHCLDECPFATP